MEKDKEKDKPKTTITYYGKKVYYISPLIARKTTAKEKVPVYRDDEANAMVQNPRKPESVD